MSTPRTLTYEEALYESRHPYVLARDHRMKVEQLEDRIAVLEATLAELRHAERMKQVFGQRPRGGW